MSGNNPNILMVVVDCARSDRWLGPQRTTRTPNVDRLCAQGVAFPTAITEKSCTTPSFSTLLSGLYSTRHGVHMIFGYRFPAQLPLLTQPLADHGYHTYAEVSGPLFPEMGLDRGFQHYEYRAPFDFLHTAWGDRFIDRLRTGYYQEPWFIMLHLWELHVPRRIPPVFDQPTFGSGEYERMVSVLDVQLGRVFDAAGEETMIIFTGDHGERIKSEPFPKEGAVYYACRLMGIDPEGEKTWRWNESRPLYRLSYLAGPSVLNQVYHQITPRIREINLRALGNKRMLTIRELLNEWISLLKIVPWLRPWDLLALRSPLKTTRLLNKRGLLHEQKGREKVEKLVNTLGLDRMLAMHVRMWISNFKNNMHDGHGVHVYDCLVRVPLVIRWREKLPAGVVHDRMVRQPDFMPTILDLTGIPYDREKEIHGRSFAPLIRGEPWQPLPAYLSLTGVPPDIELRGVRTEAYKYSFGPHNPELPEELYDLSADPREQHNLASDQPGRCIELRVLANSFTEDADKDVGEMIDLTPEQQAQIEKQLKELGYIE
jgi:arylsulfatase A-like enzyme